MPSKQNIFTWWNRALWSVNSRQSAGFRSKSLACPQSRTRSAPLTDFYRLRPLSPTAAIPVRSHVNIERRSVSNPGFHHRGPVLYQLSYRNGKLQFLFSTYPYVILWLCNHTWICIGWQHMTYIVLSLSTWKMEGQKNSFASPWFC